MKGLTSLNVIRKKNIGLLKRKMMLGYESNGLFLSFKLLKKKKKKIIEVKPIEFLKTSGYVIPLPQSEEKKKKKKIKFSVGQNFYFLYDHYDTILREARGLFIESDYTFYNPSSSLNIATFDHLLKFDILRSLQHVFGLYVERSFNGQYLKGYFSVNKLKSLTLIYFRDLFKKYGSPNLPLLRGKGSSYTPKQEGTLLLKAGEIIFRQMVFEEIGEHYEFSNYEQKIFDKLDIDPYDTHFYWPTHRLYLLGLSDYDGGILNESTDFFIRNYSEMGISISNPLMGETLNALLGKNFNSSKENKKSVPSKSSKKSSSNDLNFTTEDKKFNFLKDVSYFMGIAKKIQLPNLIVPIIKTFFYWRTQFLYLLTKEKIFLSSVDRKIELLKNGHKVFTIFSNFVPTHFCGNFNTFFGVNYFEKISHESKSNLEYFKTERFGRAFFNYFLLPKRLNYKPIINDFDFLRKKIGNRKKNFYISLITTINLFYVVDINKLKKLTFGDELCWHSLPDYLQEFFYLLLQGNLTFELFYKGFLGPVLDYFENEFYFNFFKQGDVIKNCLLFVAKRMLILDKKSIKVDRNPLSYYLHLRESLKYFPNGDDPVFGFQPFGINPFFKFVTLLKTEKSVPFPEAITKYNYYRFKKAKEKKEKAKQAARENKDDKKENKDDKKENKDDKKENKDEEGDDDEEKPEKFKVKSFHRGVLMYDVRRRALHIIRLINRKNGNSASILFFGKLFLNYYFLYNNYDNLAFSGILHFGKNFKSYFALIGFTLQFDVDLPSTVVYKFKRHGKIYKQINYRDKLELEGLYEYYRNDYCLLGRDYHPPLKLNEAQKKKLEYFKKYFASTALKGRTNYFVLDNMIVFLKLTYFFKYFSCINSVIVNNALLNYDNNLLLVLQGEQAVLHGYQLCLTENSFYYYLRAYFKIQYYFDNNGDKKILLKKNVGPKFN